MFHVSLHGAMALQGTLPGIVAVTSTMTLIFLSFLLSAVAVRYRSVWPAVFAHALPLSTLNLIDVSAGIGPAEHWVTAGITSVILLAAALVLAPRRSVEKHTLAQ